jgi:hypothetical protein
MSLSLFDGYILLRSTKTNRYKKMRLGYSKQHITRYIVHMEDEMDLQGEFVIYIGSSESEASRIFDAINLRDFIKGH